MSVWDMLRRRLTGRRPLHKTQTETYADAGPIMRFDARQDNRQYGELRAELTSFRMLRRLAETCDAVANAVQCRIDQIRSTPLSFRAPADADPEVAEGQVTQAEEFFATEGGLGGPGVTFQDLLCILVEDLLVIGCCALYRRPTKGGDTYSIEYVDAATIKPLLTDGGWRPLPPEPAYEQVDARGKRVGAFTADEMRYIRFRARSDSRWGRSPTENVLGAIAQYIAADDYNLSYFVDGDGEWSYWKVPADWSPDQIKAFDAYVEAVNKARAGKQGAARRSMPAGPERVSARPRSEAAFEKTQVHLVRRIARAFSLSASVLGFEGVQYKVAQEDQRKTAELWGENVLKLLLKGLFDDILHEDLNLPDVEAVWLDEVEDLEPVARMITQAGTQRVSPNRAREMLGLPPAEGPYVNALYEMTGAGQIVVIGWEPGTDAPQETAPEHDPPISAETRADLERWERKALRMLKEGDVRKCRFESSFIPPPLCEAIEDKLQVAKSAADVRAAFALGGPVDLARIAGDLETLLAISRAERGKREAW